MTEREHILARIREALSVPAPKPGAGREGTVHPNALPQVSAIRHWLPPVGKSFAERWDLFSKNAAELQAECRLVDSHDQFLKCLLDLRDAEAWTKVGTHSGSLTDPFVAQLKLPMCRTDQPYEITELESCTVGITQCDALVAQTGSVLVTSRSAGGRALSVLPPHHVVLARRDQLIADLPQAFELLKQVYAPNYPSFISFITGPSRTGDIERILVLGAHGPRKLSILCV